MQSDLALKKYNVQQIYIMQLAIHATKEMYQVPVASLIAFATLDPGVVSGYLIVFIP